MFSHLAGQANRIEPRWEFSVKAQKGYVIVAVTAIDESIADALRPLAAHPWEQHLPGAAVPDAMECRQRQPTGNSKSSPELTAGSGIHEPPNGKRHCVPAGAFSVSFAEKVAPLVALAMTTPASACTAMSNRSSMESIFQPGSAGFCSAFSRLERNRSAISAMLSAISPARLRNCSGNARPCARSPDADLGRTSSRISTAREPVPLASPAIVSPRQERTPTGS